MILLLYDGSLTSDFVSRYAIRFYHKKDEAVTLLHVLDGEVDSTVLSEKVNNIEKEFKRNKIKVHPVILPMKGGVFNTIQDYIRSESPQYVICGTRVRGSRKGMLYGTITESLLEKGGADVLALRVVQPGKSGLTSNMLMPVSERFKMNANAGKFLGLFAPELKQLHFFHISRVNKLFFKYLSQKKAREKLVEAHEFLDSVRHEIDKAISLERIHFDRKVMLSDDPAKEIIIQANRLKTDIIFMGTSKRSLPNRYSYGNMIEQVLRQAPCDIALYNSYEPH